VSDGAYHDSSTGQFVSKATADADPGGTQFVSNSKPDRLGELIAEITTLTESLPSWRVVIAGVEITGIDPVDMAERMAIEVRARVGGDDGQV
jgi:hypothetical protein